jgi:prepilin-type N-terminal cleavage/methylation domain-containing protein
MTSAIGKQAGLPAGRQGFTLIEVCMAAAIAALVATVSWPAFREISRASQARVRASRLRHDLQTARAQAIVRAQEQLAPPTRFYPDGGADPVDVSWPGGADSVHVRVSNEGEINVEPL